MQTSDDYIENKRKVFKEALESLDAYKGSDIIVPIEQVEKDIAKFRECNDRIIEVLKKYSDIQEEYYPLIALWILGTYTHNQFETFPLMFINATKGSGKSRLLKLISTLSHNGKIVLDLKEAVLFRTAKNHTICIDEFEGVGSKEAGTLRTMINASYKKGTAVERMKKVSKNGQEEQVVERFDLYTPVAMANIWGLEDVLSDRCLQIILEKSNNPGIVKLIEDFEQNSEIQAIKSSLNQIQCSLCSVVTEKNIIKAWNTYVLETTHNTYNTYISQTTHTTPTQTLLNDNNISIFNKINETGIDGRNLELFFPLFILSWIIGEEWLDRMLRISIKIINEKKEEEFAESRDISLIDFISKRNEYRGNFLSVHDICREFRLIATEDPEQDRWLNPKWIGRALKRSKLIIQKRRLGKGVEVMVDIDKAKVLLARFKEVITK